MAQVHRAVLTNGDEAAVKVQRPGVRTTMAQDIDDACGCQASFAFHER